MNQRKYDLECKKCGFKGTFDDKPEKCPKCSAGKHPPGMNRKARRAIDAAKRKTRGA